MPNRHPYSDLTIQKSRVSSLIEDSSGAEHLQPTHIPQPNIRNLEDRNRNSSILRSLRTLDDSNTVVEPRGVVVSSRTPPFPSVVPALVEDRTGTRPSVISDWTMGKGAQSLRHPTPTLDIVLTDDGRTSHSEGSEYDCSMEYKFYTPVAGTDMDHDTMEGMQVQNSSDSEDEDEDEDEDEEPRVDSSPRVSIPCEQSLPAARPSRTLGVPLYKVANNMPLLLPKAPFSRGRRLLIPSDSSKPIAWVSMPGDMQFIDGTSR